jgi:hypothetical protein
VTVATASTHVYGAECLAAAVGEKAMPAKRLCRRKGYAGEKAMPAKRL